MLFVTCYATILRLSVVLIEERSSLVLMALDAQRLGVSAELMRLVGAVRIVTIIALHCAFEHAMMRRLIEIGFRALVAGKAEFCLVAADHGALAHSVHCGLLLLRWVNIVARDARYASARMLADLGMALLAHLLVTLEAGLGKLLRGERCRVGDRPGSTTRGKVLSDVAMTLLAGHAIVPGLGVGCALEGGNLVVMTFGTCFRASCGFRDDCGRSGRAMRCRRCLRICRHIPHACA